MNLGCVYGRTESIGVVVYMSDDCGMLRNLLRSFSCDGRVHRCRNGLCCSQFIVFIHFFFLLLDVSPLLLPLPVHVSTTNAGRFLFLLVLLSRWRIDWLPPMHAADWSGLRIGWMYR